ncbi:Erp2,4 [Paramicrosporidium saccamoebae]|uniref:Erp2,4 n=1 Tax=Paramicrosporidium saccamoebae TaxID=1246581 RepID=A0A2H9TPL5_9FUNG|nr:Erp2,4 [Paramicrosporidium saccamoebae]
MQLPATSSLVPLFLAAGLFVTSQARSLSYRMKGSENKSCFYAYVDPKVPLNNALLQFYYAAGDAKGSDIVYVDASVTGPSGQPLHSQSRQTHAEVNIKPPQAGEYALCLTHHGSPSDKNVDVDVTLPTMPPQANQEKDDTAKLEATVHKLQRELSDLVHTLRYVKNRERRNLETVESVEGWVFYISIFEGLKRAEQFITVLRNAGYRNEAGRTLKPEHLDHEFESRPTTAALLALADGLRARVLLQHLANLGLLDGLLEGLDEAEQPKVMPTSEKIERLYELNGQLERLLDAQSISEQTCLAELEKLPLVERVETIDVLSITQSKSEPLDMLIAEYDGLQEQIKETLDKCFEKLFTPLDTTDPDEPVLRFKTISNSDLIRQPWHPEDYAFYESKITKAIDALRMYGFKLCIEELVHGDQQIRARRSAYQAEMYSQITALQLRRLCLGTIFHEALNNLGSHLQKSCNELLGSLNSAKSKMSPVSTFAQYTVNDPLTSVAIRRPSHTHRIEDHVKRLKSLESSIAQVSHLSLCFLNDAAEVEPLPLSVKHEESALRSITMEMSEMLSLNATEAERVRLILSASWYSALYDCSDTVSVHRPKLHKSLGLTSRLGPVTMQYYILGNAMPVRNRRLGEALTTHNVKH